MQYVEFDETNLQSFEINKTISSDKNIIGTCELGTAELQLLNDSNEYSDFKDKWIKTIHGSFYIYNVEPVQERVNIKFSCYDIKYLLDVKYEQNKFEDIFPCDIATWRNKIAERYGIQFNDNDNFPFADLILDKHPYVGEDVSVRDVMKQMSQACVSYIDTDSNDFFYFSWFDFSNPINIEDWLELTTEKKATDKVNVAVLGRGDVEDIVSYPNPSPSNPKEFRIDNNYILDPQESDGVDSRTELVETVYNRVKDFKYTIYSMRTQSATNVFDIKLGSSIKYSDIWGNQLESVVMSTKLNWLGGNLEDSENYEITISAEEINETSTEFSYKKSVENLAKDASITANKNKAEINMKVSKGETISDINMTPGNATINSDKISLKGKTIDLTSDIIKIIAKNFSVDEDGDLVCNNAEINGGKIILTDGGVDDASIIFKKITKTLDDIELGTDLSSAILFHNFDKYIEESPERIEDIPLNGVIFVTENGYKLNCNKWHIGDANNIHGWYGEVFISKDSDESYHETIYKAYYTYYDEFEVEINNAEFELPFDFGKVVEVNKEAVPFNFFKKKSVTEDLTNYSSTGINAKIFSTSKYNSEDYQKLVKHLQGNLTLNPEEKEFLDANGDGKLNVADTILVLNNGGRINVSKDNYGELIIDTLNPEKTIRLIDKDGNIEASIGLDGLYASTKNNLLERVDFIEVGEALSYKPKEVESVCGTWIDGKRIYRRIVEITPWEDEDYSITHTEFISSEVDTLVKLDGFIYNQHNCYCPLNMWYSSNNQVSTHFSTNDGCVRIKSTYPCRKGVIVAEYTKTGE